MVPVSLKELAFTMFLLLFYNQVLGLPARFASLAILLALIVDAVTDPLVGSWSDNFRHRLGRRHPFMYAASAPFAISIYFLFAPLVSGENALFVWLLVCAVAVRLSFTFFSVPWNAMFAELSDDYSERSELVAYRFAVGWMVGIVFVFSIYAFIFVSTPEYPQGQLNPAHYHDFAVVLAITIFIGAWTTTHLTRSQIPYLRQPGHSLRAFSFAIFYEEVVLACRNRDFRLLIFAVLASAVVSGTNQGLQAYMSTYFWGFGGDQLKWMSLAVFGGLIAFLTVVPLQNAFDKKYLLVGCSLAIMFVTMVPVTLRLLELAPANGTPELTALIVCTTAVVAYFTTIGLIMFTSMVADTLDVQEYETGLRQEGLFNSVMTFSGKAATGVGILVVGFVLDYVIQIPQNVESGTLPAETVLRIGVMDAYVVPLFNLLWLWLALKFSITRAQHADIQRKLGR